MTLKNDRLLYALIAVLTLSIVGGLSPVSAQEDDEEVFTLSPFTIDENENVGYLARSSLAGTRLKAPLRDIAATISVITEEFMEDTGSNDLQELLLYTANTEVLGIGGNFGNPNESRSVGGVLDSQFTRPTTNTRVRGLASADLTRNYFPTIIAMDSYNTSRVVINRGANAILFGLGSPAGIINNQTIAPIFEDHTEVSFQVGSYNSHRSEMDIERVIIEDKLSVRVAILNEEQFYQQKPAFEHDSRVTVAGEWRPFENTVVRLTTESGSITANRPRQIPPQDMVSRWYDVSPTGKAKPTHNPAEAFQLFLRETPTGPSFDNLYWGPIGFTFESAAVYAGPQYGVAGGALPNGADAFTAIIHPRYGPDAITGVGFQSFVTIRGYNQLLQNLPASTDQNGNLKSASRNFYVNEVIQDTSLFDFRNKMFDGVNKSEIEKFDVITGSIEQTFLDGQAGLAYHFNKEEYRSDFMQIIGDGTRFGAIAIDVNEVFQNGNPNPNLGRLFASAGGNGGRTRQFNQALENHRFTGFFKFDATERVDGFIGELLGNHTFTALIEDAKTNSQNYTLANYSWDERFRTTANPSNPANRQDLGSLIYISGDISGQSSSAGANASNLFTKLEIQPEYSLNYRDRDTALHTTGTFGIVPDVPLGGLLSKNNIESKAFILHSGFLEDHLVATFGYREDDVQVWTNNNPPRTANNSRNITPSEFFLPDSPGFTSSTDSTSWGVVAHVPDEWLESLGGVGLSLHFSKSDNAQIGSARANLRGENLGPVSGETEERGFTISFADNRFSIRVNEYETLQIGEASGLIGNYNQFMGPYLGVYPPVQLERAIEADLLEQADIANYANIAGRHFQGSEYVESTVTILPDGESLQRVNPPGLVFPTDLLSEGLEIEAVANLTSNWRLMFNISQQEVSATNTAPLLSAFIGDTVDPILDEFGHFPQSDRQVETMRSFTERFGLVAAKTAIAEDGGKKTNEIREWRWNLVTNYAFDNDSRLAGFNVGAAVRWQDEVGIGRPVIDDPELGFVPDLANPIFGPDELQIDAWVGWEKMIGPYFGQDTLLRVQLNVRNLTNEDDLIPLIANPDGTIPVIRIPAERRFELRGTLSY